MAAGYSTDTAEAIISAGVEDDNAATLQRYQKAGQIKLRPIVNPSTGVPEQYVVTNNTYNSVDATQVSATNPAVNNANEKPTPLKKVGN